LPDEAIVKTGRLFYRRIKPDWWEDYADRRLLEVAFHISERETGLSVFDAAYATPDSTLEHQLNLWRVIAARDEKGAKYAAPKLAKCNDCVDGMKQARWGVVAVYEAEFIRLSLDTSGHIDAHGHLIIPGVPDTFVRVARHLANHCRDAYALNPGLP
jgi:hypothetical protein